jgi:hypothetical protein
LIDRREFSGTQPLLLHQGKDRDDGTNRQKAIGKKRDKYVRLNLPRCWTVGDMAIRITTCDRSQSGKEKQAAGQSALFRF